MRILINNWNLFKLFLIFTFTVFLVNSCVSIRTEYPTIEYYRLEQDPLTLKNVGKIDATILIREVIPSSELESTSLMGIWDDGRIQRYNYHQWNSEIAPMVTDFIIKRLNLYSGFSGGVIKSTSSILPDYILETQLIDMMAYNSEKGNEGNYVFVSLQANLIRRIPLDTNKNIILSQVYNQKISRKNNSVKSIAPAFSTAFSLLTDKLLIDIQSAIATYR